MPVATPFIPYGSSDSETVCQHGKRFINCGSCHRFIKNIFNAIASPSPSGTYAKFAQKFRKYKTENTLPIARLFIAFGCLLSIIDKESFDNTMYGWVGDEKCSIFINVRSSDGKHFVPVLVTNRIVVEQEAYIEIISKYQNMEFLKEWEIVRDTETGYTLTDEFKDSINMVADLTIENRVFTPAFFDDGFKLTFTEFVRRSPRPSFATHAPYANGFNPLHEHDLDISSEIIHADNRLIQRAHALMQDHGNTYNPKAVTVSNVDAFAKFAIVKKAQELRVESSSDSGDSDVFDEIDDDEIYNSDTFDEVDTGDVYDSDEELPIKAQVEAFKFDDDNEEEEDVVQQIISEAPASQPTKEEDYAD